MKVLSDLASINVGPPDANEIILPQGIVGFGAYRRAELLYMTEHLPFLWMRLHGPDTIHFIVMEPGGIIPDYQPDIFDEDADQLGLTDSSEAMILNIVTLRQQRPIDATVNLIGPIIVNRRTRKGRQLVISNYSQYSAHYALVDHVSVGQITARTA